ncbi:NUDIX hydrolase domain-like protein [Trichoderma evansii]
MATSKHVESLPVGRSVNQQVLSSSAEKFRNSHASVSGRPYDKVVVGAATLQYASSSPSKTPRILLLKRAPHELYFPNVFELPSGKVDPDDPTLKHALFREVKEETGLDVTEILAELRPMIYSTEKITTGAAGEEVLVSKSAIQLNYVVLVSPGTIKLNTDEHSESCWASEADLGGLDITNAMRAVIQEAFQWALSQ